MTKQLSGWWTLPAKVVLLALAATVITSTMAGFAAAGGSSSGSVHAETDRYYSRIHYTVTPTSARAGDTISVTFTFDDRLPAIDCTGTGQCNPTQPAAAANYQLCLAGLETVPIPPTGPEHTRPLAVLFASSLGASGSAASPNPYDPSINRGTHVACYADTFPGAQAGTSTEAELEPGTATGQYQVPALKPGTYALYPAGPPDFGGAHTTWSGSPARFTVKAGGNSQTGTLGSGTTQQATTAPASRSSGLGATDLALAGATVALVGAAAGASIVPRRRRRSSARRQDHTAASGDGGPSGAPIATIALGAARVVAVVEIVRAALDSDGAGIALGVGMFAVSFANIPLRHLARRREHPLVDEKLASLGATSSDAAPPRGPEPDRPDGSPE